MTWVWRHYLTFKELEIGNVGRVCVVFDRVVPAIAFVESARLFFLMRGVSCDGHLRSIALPADIEAKN